MTGRPSTAHLRRRLRNGATRSADWQTRRVRRLDQGRGCRSNGVTQKGDPGSLPDDPQLNNTGIAYESDRVLKARDYIDLSTTWTMGDNLKFRAGINNLFDVDPPLTGASNCPTGSCSGNTWPQLYDAFGRYAFIGLTADF